VLPVLVLVRVRGLAHSKGELHRVRACSSPDVIRCRSFREVIRRLSLEQAYSLFRFLEATAALGTQIVTPPRLTRVGPPK
jgi:hypothetical protein